MVTERCIPLLWQQANTEVCCWDWGFGMWPEGVGGGGWAWGVCGWGAAMQPGITNPQLSRGQKAGLAPPPGSGIRGERLLGVIPWDPITTPTPRVASLGAPRGPRACLAGLLAGQSPGSETMHFALT